MITKAGAGAIIKNSNDQVFLVRIEREEGKVMRWELPSGIRDTKEESIFITLYRCAEQESLSQFTVKIGRAVCMVLNISAHKKHQYFGMFFECKAEVTGIKTEELNLDLPDKARQKVINAAYCNWWSLDPIDIHPQHLEILKKWSSPDYDETLFAVVSDADSELAFYHKTGTVKSSVLEIYTPPSPMESRLKKIFISYSQYDNRHKEKLLDMLTSLRGQIVCWNDEDLLPGEKWDQHIKNELHNADIVLFLVSPKSMASDYIQREELPVVMQRCDAGKCLLIPIIVDFYNWEKQDIAKYVVLPTKGHPVIDRDHWQTANEAWASVVKHIEELIAQQA